MNREVQAISPKARKLKQGWRFDEAVALYTHCLELDCCYHWYSFHRAETFFMAASKGSSQLRLYELAIEDAQYTIALDPTCQPAWSVIRCLIDSLQLEQARCVCEVTLRLFPRGSERYVMLKRTKLQIHQATLPAAQSRIHQ